MGGRADSQQEPRKRFRYEIWLTALGITLLSFAIRFALLDRYAGPPSGDFGNYLMISNIIMGKDVTGYGLRYPPLFFLILISFVKAFGPMLGVKLLAAIAASSSCIPMFFFVMRRANYYVAIAITPLFTFSQAMAEMTAWGGDPNFLAITFLIAVLYFLDRSLSGLHSYKMNAVAAGIFAGLTFETHHLTFMVLAFTLVLFFVPLFVWNNHKDRRTALLVFAWMAVPAVLVALPGIPTYLRIQESLSASLGSYGPPSPNALFGPEGFKYITGAYWLAWAVVYALGGIAIAYCIRKKAIAKSFKLILVASILSPLLLGAFVIGGAPGRVFMFLPIPLLLGFGILMVRFNEWVNHISIDFHLASHFRRVILSLLVADIVLLSAAGIQWMSYAVDWYHPLEDNDIEALDWIADNTPEDAVFATSGKILAGQKEGDRLGWWIQGYSERRAIMAGSEKFRLFQDELESTRDMNRFFLGTHVLENGRLQISDQYPIAYMGNPEISVRREGVYTPILFLNDAMHTIYYRTDSLNQTEYAGSLVGATPSDIEIVKNETTIAARAKLTTPRLVFERETSVVDEQPRVDINFRVYPASDAVLSALEMPLWCPHGSSFTEVISSDSFSTFVVNNPWKNPITVSVYAQEGGGDLLSYEFAEQDPVWNLPVLRLRFAAENNLIDILVSVEAESTELDELSHLEYYNGYELLSKYGVDYLYESLSMGLEVERLEKDSTHFEVAFRNDGVKIFRVLF